MQQGEKGGVGLVDVNVGVYGIELLEFVSSSAENGPVTGLGAEETGWEGFDVCRLLHATIANPAINRSEIFSKSSPQSQGGLAVPRLRMIIIHCERK